jgi:nucleoid-associated protein YgaU
MVRLRVRDLSRELVIRRDFLTISKIGPIPRDDELLGCAQNERARNMDRKKKIGLALLIVGIGTAIALQFRKDPQAVDSAPAIAEARPVQPAVAAPLADAPQAVPPREPQTATVFDGRIEPAPGSTVAPRDPLAGKTADGSGGVPGNAPQSISTGVDEERSAELVELNAPERTHRIMDGDSLPKLAQRYLGRADRYLELYAYNRDVLSDPEVLPIGASIRIPSRVVFAPEGNATADVTPQPVIPLTPLAPLPAATTAAPPAAAATASAQRNGPRTYTVQEGDNLVDIARKLYGDGRRYEALFQANRRSLRTPNDLKPGMVLIAP